MELPVKRVWYRSLTRIGGVCSRGAHTKTSATRPPSTARLPLEIVEMIIAHLIYDTPGLIACSLTCSSWYIAVAPHLHHTLTMRTSQWPKKKFIWPEPLRHMHRLGLLPLVKKLQVHEGYFQDYYGITPRRLDCRTLYHFFALTSVQELEVDHLDIPKLMPRIRRYFKNFLPTLRSLALKQPKGSRRQLLYFIGLFQHLEDLKICYKTPWYLQEPADEPALVPLFAPPLQGRLTVASVWSAVLLKDMVHVFGGIRFRHVDLFGVGNVRPWIDACAKTLETLRVYPTSEQPSVKGAQVLANHLADRLTGLSKLDLSRHKSLRTLEVPASCVHGAYLCESPHIAAILLKYVLSTITSPTFFEVVVVYRDYDFHGIEPPECPTNPPVRRM